MGIDTWARAATRMPRLPIPRIHPVSPLPSAIALARHRALFTAEEYQRVTGKAGATKAKGQRRAEFYVTVFSGASPILIKGE